MESQRSGNGVGRQEELDQVGRLLEREGRGAAWAFVTGEPGIGKTWLLRQVAALARASGTMVVRACGSEFESHVPFGLLVHALDDYLATLEPERLHALGGERVGDLARVFPALAGYGYQECVGLQDSTYRAHRAVRALLERLAEPAGLVLLLDDLQWADPQSLALIAHLLERPPRGRLTIVGAWRGGLGSEALAGLSLRCELPGAMVRLGPIGEQDAAALLDTVEGPLRRARLMRQSGGNPFYLRELARAAVQQAGGEDEHCFVPPSITEAVHRELAVLSSGTRDVLAAAAVLGEAFDLDLACAVSGAPEAAAAAAATGELTAAGLLRETGMPRQFVFRRPIVRQAVYQLTPPGWRLAAHRRAALELADAPVRQRAEHLARFAVPPDPAAVDVLVRAGRESLVQDPDTAVALLRAASELSRGDQATHRETLLAHADAAAGTGRLPEARCAYEAALRSGADKPADGWLATIGTLATIDQLTGDAALSSSRVRMALARAGGAAGAQSGFLLVLAASAAALNLDWHQARQHAAEALRHTEAARDPVGQAAAASLLGIGELARHRIDAARAARQTARSLVAGLPGGRDEHPHALLALGWLEILLEDYPAALTLLGRLPMADARQARAWWSGPAHLLVARAELALGRLAGAAAASDLAIELGRDGGAPPVLAHGLAIRAAVLSAAGDAAEAVRAARDAVRAARDGSPLQAVMEQARAAIQLDLGEGSVDLEAVRRLSQHTAWTGPAQQCAWQHRLAQAALDDGQPEAAAEAAATAEAIAQATGLAMAVAYAGWTRAAVLTARRQYADAAQSAARAAQAAAPLGRRIETGRIQMAEAYALTLAGQRDRAARVLRGALEEFRLCAAVRHEREAARQLRRLGRRPPPIAVPPSEDEELPLSERERQVAELVAAGRTNRQIAAQLLLSGKTVETHLTRIFAKLGISSRTLLARMVEHERSLALRDRRAS